MRVASLLLGGGGQAEEVVQKLLDAMAAGDVATVTAAPGGGCP